MEASHVNTLSATHGSWIHSRLFDLLLISGSCLVVVLVLVARRFWDVSPMSILAVVAILANGPHLAATWLRVYVDRAERQSRPLAYMGVPLLICAAVLGMGLYTTRGPRLILTVVVSWALWHFAAQCYGLMRIYQKKSREDLRRAHRVESWLIFLICITGICWRLHFGPTKIMGMALMYPEAPVWLVWLAGTLVGGMVVYLIADRLRPGIPLGTPRLIFLASVAVSFWVPLMVIKNGTTAFAAAAGWHGLQYIAIVWFYNRKRFGGQDAQPGTRLISWISQPGRTWAFVGLLFLLIGAVYGTVELLLVLAAGAAFAKVVSLTWVCLSLSHYWVDGLIWKMRKPQISTTLTGAT
jgi:hypothetical protein